MGVRAYLWAWAAIAVCLIAGLVFLGTPPLPVRAQSRLCGEPSTSISITTPGGTATLGRTASRETVYVCAYNITAAVTAGTTVQFSSGGTNLTGTMTMPAWGSITAGNGDANLFQGVTGSTITVTCASGQCFGWVKHGQS